MIFFENERSKVWTLRVSFREIARIFGFFGVFDLGCYWLKAGAVYSRPKSKVTQNKIRVRKIKQKYN